MSKKSMNSLGGYNGVQQLGHVRTISRDAAGQGFNSKSGALGSSTVLNEYDSQGGGRSPLVNRTGNPDTAMRTRSGAFSTDHGNQSNPESNGKGVVFSIGTGQGNAPLIDSPVPTGSQRPLQDQASVASAMASGEGGQYGANQGIPDCFPDGGVMGGC